MISTSLLLLQFFADDHSYLWQSVINDAIIDEWCKRIQACNVVFVQKDDILNI